MTTIEPPFQMPIPYDGPVIRFDPDTDWCQQAVTADYPRIVSHYSLVPGATDLMVRDTLLAAIDEQPPVGYWGAAYRASDTHRWVTWAELFGDDGRSCDGAWEPPGAIDNPDLLVCANAAHDLAGVAELLTGMIPGLTSDDQGTRLATLRRIALTVPDTVVPVLSRLGEVTGSHMRWQDGVPEPHPANRTGNNHDLINHATFLEV